MPLSHLTPALIRFGKRTKQFIAAPSTAATAATAAPAKPWPHLRRAAVCAWVVLSAQLGSAAAQTPVHGGTLTWVVRQEPAAFVPLATTAGSSTDLGPKVVEGLLTYDRELNPLPLLATAWSISPDGLEYRFQLREGVQWHDGQPFTADDVVFSIEALKAVNPRGRVTFANLASASAPDAHTVVLKLSKPAPYLITALAAAESPIVPKHLYEGKDIATNPLNNAPIGTGPFLFKEWVKGSHVQLVRNPNYWDKPKPYLDGAVARFISEPPVAAAALESGEVQLGQYVIPLTDVERFKKLPQVQVSQRDVPYVGNHQQIYFNFDNPVFQNQQVRQAVSQAINVEAFGQTIWYGLGTLAATPIGRGQARFSNPAIAHYPFDPKAAEAALDAAGYPRKADGKRFKVRVLYNPWVDKRGADFVRQSLQRIGIDAEVESLDFATYVNRVYTERAFDLTLENLLNVFDPTIGVQRAFWSPAFKVGVPFTNPSHYSNPEVDRLLEAAAIETNPDKRQAYFYEFQRVLHDDAASIELGAPPSVLVADKRLRDFDTTAQSIRDSFANVYFAQP